MGSGESADLPTPKLFSPRGTVGCGMVLSDGRLGGKGLRGAFEGSAVRGFGNKTVRLFEGSIVREFKGKDRRTLWESGGQLACCSGQTGDLAIGQPGNWAIVRGSGDGGQRGRELAP